jgi:hypothetical protein
MACNTCKTNCTCKSSNEPCRYEGPNIDCVGITSGDSIETTVRKITDYLCSITDIPSTGEISCGTDVVVPNGTGVVDALSLITAYFCGFNHEVSSDITCGTDVVVEEGSDLTTALSSIVLYFCAIISTLPTVTLASDGSVSSESIVKNGLGPSLTTKGLVAGTDVSIIDDGTDLTIAFTGTGVTQQNVFSNIYDSGWVVIPNFNGTFGIAPIVGKPDFELRVVDRIVFIRGIFIIPLDNPAAPGSLINLFSDYALPTSGKDVLTNLGGGFVVNTDQQSITSREPIIPSDLFPDKAVRLNDFNSVGQRGCMVNGGATPTVEYLLTAIINARLGIDGKLSISTQKDQDDTARNIVLTPGAADTKRNSEAYHLVSKHSLGNPILTYENIDYVASAAAGSIVYTGIDTGEVYPFSFDGKQANEIGGFPIVIQVSYPLNPTVTLTDIQNAIASM